jgi:hypothetical protein
MTAKIMTPAEVDRAILTATQIPDEVIDEVNNKLIDDFSCGQKQSIIYKHNDLTSPQWYNLQDKLQKMGWVVESVSEQLDGTYLRVTKK